MDYIGCYIFLAFLGISVAQVWIPKRELGFVYNGGKSDAPVKIDAFLDLLCPDSKKAYEVVRKVADHYGPSKLQMKIHMFPLPYHKNAFNAGKGAFAVNKLTGGIKTFDWIDSVFDNMATFSNGHTHTMTGADVINDLTFLAESLGIRRTSFQSLMTSNTQLELEARLAWKYGCTRAIHSTPMILINDILINTQNPQNLTVEEWKRLIDPLLFVAKNKIFFGKRGTS